MTETEVLAYFAGTMDSDGSLTISRVVKANGRIYHAARVTYSQSDRPKVAEMMKARYDGSISAHVPDKGRVHYQWYCEARKAERFVRDIRPFLVLKVAQADFLLEFLDVRTSQWAEIRETQKPPYRVTDEMIAERDRLWAEVYLLNRQRARGLRNREVARRILGGREGHEHPKEIDGS